MSNEDDDFKSTKQVLKLIGLAEDEIETFFHLTGRGPVMVGEISLIIDVTEERAAEIAKNLLEKGLVREIPGKTPFYIALPPYSALLSQIQQFKKVVENIQETTPKVLQSKFQKIEEQSAKLGKLNEYRNYIQMMKKNLPAQIKAQFGKVEKELESVKKFQEIRRFILNLREIVPEEIIKEFGIMETRLEKIKLEISEAFEKQFRIGALKSMAEKIVSRIISEQFSDLTDYFKAKFVGTIQNTLDQVTDQLSTISDAAGEMSTDLGGALSDIELGLRDTLEDLDGRIAAVYDDVESGIEELKQMFQQEIYATLEEDVIKNILQQLDLSEQTMTEFWERSKSASMLTFKDVWFVRSIEGMKAQINESISRVKMRVFIIAPKLDDIDLVALSKVKKHINVRISTNFDWDNPNHQLKLGEIAQYPNIDIRLYNRENLYTINRDYEEVVVCVVAKKELGDIEIAGMGSILEEHVKLFAGVIEDVWMQSKKVRVEEFSHLIKAPKTTIRVQQQIQPTSYLNIAPTPKTREAQVPSVSLKTINQIESSIASNNTKIEPIKQKPAILTQIKGTVDITANKKGSISKLFDFVINDLDKKLGTELSNDLENIRNRITEEIGYTAVLNQISITIASLKTVPKLLSPMEVEDTLKKINFWRKKINV